MSHIDQKMKGKSPSTYNNNSSFAIVNVNVDESVTEGSTSDEEVQVDCAYTAVQSDSDTVTVSTGELFDYCYHDEWTYEIDLQLAAELGKGLLQRNKELENELTTVQDLAEDQALEIDFLSKQVQLLRDESDTRLAACEMMESQLQELKRSEGNLQELRNLDYMRITRLQDTVEVLQSRCDDLQTNLAEMKRKNWEDKFAANTLSTTAPSSGMTRSISHGDALKTAGNKHQRADSDEENEDGSEAGILHEKVKVLQRQLLDERKQRELLQDQVKTVTTDNNSLWQQLDHVTKEAAGWREKLEILTNKYADEIATINEQREKGAMENKNPIMNNGINGDKHVEPCCQVQLSILDEIADTLRDRFLFDLKTEHQEHQHDKPDPADLKDSHVKTKSTQTDTSLILDYLASQGGDPTHGRFQRGPPEYKKLFKEIFDIIKKSQEEDLAKAQQPKKRQPKTKKQIVYYYNQF